MVFKMTYPQALKYKNRLKISFEPANLLNSIIYITEHKKCDCWSCE